ncbi:MAG: SUMF1/EgtB/PvdO family nonheme iron enzyme [Pyrinomonadaceae bacterium]|nr:SUMF1/EgtB/PvdO family nonheme iron enzyme [Pyrinomonadaceae bacterium]
MTQTPPFESESIAIIIDNSYSASSALMEARQAAQRICLMIGSEQLKLFMLGSSTPISQTILKQVMPQGVNPQTQPCSLIAPIIGTLTLEEQKHSVVIIGNGEIFDLDDWTDNPQVDGWLLICTGEESLQASLGRVAEVKLDQIPWDDIETLLSYFSRSAQQPARSNYKSYGADQYQWQVDTTGYPLILVEPLDAYVHLFPVTKPQFEKFIASGRKPGFGDEWYTELLELNPRVSYRSADVSSPDGLFMTGVTTDEASDFCRWLGRDFRLLTAEGWTACYDWFAEQGAVSMPDELRGHLSQDAEAIWELIEDQWLDPQSTLQDLSLMRRGILEWVEERPGRYCGLGEPASARFQRSANDPVRPLGRLKNLGFRLCTRLT